MLTKPPIISYVYLDYKKTEGNNINVVDIAHDSRHGHYLNPGQCEHLKHLNNQVTFITEYAYSKMCYTVSEGKYNKKICRYSDTKQIKVAEKWFKGIVLALEKIGQDSVQYPKTYESANLVLEKKFSLVVAGHEDECRPHEKFHGNHKNIVICHSFKLGPKDSDLTKFFFNKIKECNVGNTCHFPDHQQIENIDDLLSEVVLYSWQGVGGGRVRKVVLLRSFYKR